MSFGQKGNPPKPMNLYRKEIRLGQRTISFVLSLFVERYHLYLSDKAIIVPIRPVMVFVFTKENKKGEICYV